jgi:hypothetical protein
MLQYLVLSLHNRHRLLNHAPSPTAPQPPSTYRLCSSVNNTATLSLQKAPSAATGCVSASSTAACSSSGYVVNEGT